MQAFFASPLFAAAQIIGFAAMAMGILVYQFRRHSVIMFVKVLISVMWCVHYGLLGLWPALFINVLNVVRDTVFGLREKKNINSPAVPAVFCLLSLAAVICGSAADAGSFSAAVFASGAVPAAASVFSTVAHWQKNTKRLKIFAVPGNVLWLVYDIVCKSLSGAVNDAFVLCSIGFSLFRIAGAEKKEKHPGAGAEKKGR